MPMTRVQRVTAGTGAAAASLTATYSPAPTNGNLLICMGNSDATLTMTSTGWTLGTSQVNNTGLYQWWKIAGASESTTVVLTPSASDSVAMIIQEWSGNATGTAVDKTAAGTNGSSSTGTTATTVQGDEEAFAQIGTSATGGSATTATWTNSFVSEGTGVRGLATVNIDLLAADLALSTTQTVTTTATVTGTGVVSGALVCTYKASAAPAVAQALHPKRMPLGV